MSQAAETPSLLVLTPEGEEFHYILDLAEIQIGRDAQCTIPLTRPGVSRHHAQIRIEGGQATIQDLGSTNGTLLNGKRLGEDPEPLRDGAVVTISRIEIRYIDPAAQARREEQAATYDDAMATRLGTVLTDGTLGTMIAQSLELLDTPEAEASLLKVVLARPIGPRLLIREECRTREQTLGQKKLLVGRGPECGVRLADQKVSTRHAAIRPAGDGYLIKDLDSRNGTLVNAVEIREHQLTEGDLVRIGNTTMVFRDPRTERTRSGVSPGKRRPVVIIPGFIASELWKGDEMIWPNHLRLVSSSEKALERDWQDLRVGQIVRQVTILPGFLKNDSFGLLIRFLTDELGYKPDRDYLEFPYDWRLDNRETARRLAETVKDWRQHRENPTEKITVIAHSMGGLVARLFLSAYGGEDAVERCIFLGTPHQGSGSAMLVAVAGMGFLPFGIAMRKLKRFSLQFPSFHQLLPEYPVAELENGQPFLPLEVFPDWLDKEYRPHLEAAKAMRRLLRSHEAGIPVPNTCIFGYNQKTVERLVLRQERSGQVNLVSVEHSKHGDGTVIEKSTVMPGSEIHPVTQQHGALHSDRDVLRRLKFELVER